MTTEKAESPVFTTPTPGPTPTDWTTDFDIFNHAYMRDPFPIWDEIREGKCPIAHTDRYGRSAWMPTRYDDMFKIAQDWQHFSSREILVAPPLMEGGPAAYDAKVASGEIDDPFPGVAAPPITSDPPEHTWARKLLLPPFSMRSVEKFEDLTREHCRSLIDGFIANGKADAAADYAQQIPPYVIARMLGVSTEMTPTFVQWVRDLLEFGFFNPEAAMGARNALLGFLWTEIQSRRQEPKDDLMTYLVQSKVEGLPVPDTHVLGTCLLIVVAGIDTTWSSIGSALWHLAQHPEHRKWIIENPDQITSAIEELLRAYSPVTMARVVDKQQTVNGATMCPEEKVIMNFPAANRDPEVFENADQVILDRPKNPHIAFGVGIHRCAGSNLARMEMRVAIQEWLGRIPDYRLEDPEVVTWAGGQVRGPRKLPVVFS